MFPRIAEALPAAFSCGAEAVPTAAVACGGPAAARAMVNKAALNRRLLQRVSRVRTVKPKIIGVILCIH